MEEDIDKRRKREREDMLFELEVKERMSQLKDAEEARKDREVARKVNNLTQLDKFTGFLSTVSPNWKSDARLCLQLECEAKNVMFGQRGITNGEDEPSPSVSISLIAKENGYNLKQGDLVAIGRKVAKAYFTLHGKKPSKHRQWVDGAEYPVNSYTEKDRKMIEEAIRGHMEEEEDSEC